jgi:hypothetical protein
MKYDHKFTCQFLLLHRDKGRNRLLFVHFEGRKNVPYTITANAFCTGRKGVGAVHWPPF